MTVKLSFQVSADTRFLVQRLTKIEVGESVSYADLAAEIGKPVDGSTKALYSARRILLRDEHRVFGTITGLGLKRLNDLEIVETANRTSQTIRRTARRGVRTLTAVADFSSLPRDQQMRHTAALSVFGVVAEMTSSRGIARVEKMTEGASTALPIAQTLAAFSR